MMQTRLGSFVEAWANVFVGGAIAYAANILWSHWLNIHISHSQNFKIVVIMTVISIVRSYLLRRFFNKLRLFTYAARNLQEGEKGGEATQGSSQEKAS